MKNISNHDDIEAAAITEQARVELAVLMGIEKAIRIAIDWEVRDGSSVHKLSTLRFLAASFERHLTRITVRADRGGYMHRITDAKPHLTNDVQELRGTLRGFRTDLERIVMRLDYVTSNDDAGIEQVCLDFKSILDELATHGQEKSELMQHAFVQEEGGEG
ncbi:MAG: hypothetical protein DHS20C16_08550 [Phycisphaerae bacterium]|nr:MAG: hypothetical protein DHS20C16_08550 [Phycisphaerae bacterium]